MEGQQAIGSYSFHGDQTEELIRKGPWTVEEDAVLSGHIAMHGEGRWNTVARSAGLKRSGKSCRLRWLNYLKPNVRRGNITLQEQLLILQLHCRWGNRWSKIAQFLPGRTDNEIKNYWRTRVQKQAKQLNCDVNSKQFKDAMHHVWMPRILERIQASQPTPVLDDNINTVPSAEAAGQSTFMPEELSGSSSDSQVEHQHYENPYYSDGGIQSGSDSYPGNGDPGCWDWENNSMDSLESFWNEENICFLQQQLMS